MLNWTRWVRAALPALMMMAYAVATAQDFPSKPVRVIISASPGSVVDLVSRTLSSPLAAALGQPVVIENVVGASSITGTDRVARAPKDGYTLGVISNNHVINPSMIKNIPFDSVKDFSVVTVLGTTPLVLVAHPSVPAQNARELMALAKAKPGTLNYGSAGTGTVLHLAGVLLAGAAGIDIKHVPYKAFSGMLNDVLGGQIEMGFSGLPAAAQHIKSGKLRAIGMSTATRSPVLPDVPTLAEAGVPGYSYDAWMTLVVPAGVPKPVLDRLHAAVRTALSTPEVQQVFSTQGITAVGSAADPASTFLQAELDKHARLVKTSGATLD
jgi:tripartite-type tricarboxylate transporter receptor subunit TctC